jgi:hypothetical protein
MSRPNRSCAPGGTRDQPNRGRPDDGTRDQPNRGSPHVGTRDQPNPSRVPVTRRILAELERAGNRTLPGGDKLSMFPSAWTRPGPLIGMPEGFTYVELARKVYETPEPTTAQIKAVQRAAKRLVEAGRIERQSWRGRSRRHPCASGIVVSRIPTDADHEFRARLLREYEEVASD